MAGDEEEDVDLDAPKIYEPIENYEQLSDRLKMFQAQYNEIIRGSEMDLVFFKVCTTTHISVVVSVFHYFELKNFILEVMETFSCFIDTQFK